MPIWVDPQVYQGWWWKGNHMAIWVDPQVLSAQWNCNHMPICIDPQAHSAWCHTIITGDAPSSLFLLPSVLVGVTRWRLRALSTWQKVRSMELPHGQKSKLIWVKQACLRMQHACNTLIPLLASGKHEPSCLRFIRLYYRYAWRRYCALHISCYVKIFLESWVYVLIVLL